MEHKLTPEIARLPSLYAGLQTQLLAQFGVNRNASSHSVVTGDSLEKAWINWLKVYLPDRYSIDRALAIDHTGNTSQQLDIVIYDSWYTPFVLNQDGLKYVPVEGIYAVFEVKSAYSKHAVRDAAKKVESVRNLLRTSTTFINGGTEYPPRPLTLILGGLLCNSFNGSQRNFQKRLSSHLIEFKSHQTLDLGCVLDSGAFVVDYANDSTSNQSNSASDKNKDKGEVLNSEERQNQLRVDHKNYLDSRSFSKLIVSDREYSGPAFFLQLSRYIQQAIGTVPAIDLAIYANGIMEIDSKP